MKEEGVLPFYEWKILDMKIEAGSSLYYKTCGELRVIADSKKNSNSVQVLFKVNSKTLNDMHVLLLLLIHMV